MRGRDVSAFVASSLCARLFRAVGRVGTSHSCCVCCGVTSLPQGAADALFGAVSTALASAPDSLDPYQLASLYEAAAGNPGAKLPEQARARA